MDLVIKMSYLNGETALISIPLIIPQELTE